MAHFSVKYRDRSGTLRSRLVEEDTAEDAAYFGSTIGREVVSVTPLHDSYLRNISRMTTVLATIAVLQLAAGVAAVLLLRS